MGIKITISKEDLPLKYRKYHLKETIDGVSDSVYLMGDKYVLKVFQNKEYEIESEKILLNSIKALKVSQFVESFKVFDNIVVVYKQIAGESLYNPAVLHIKQIAIFLKEFHNISKSLVSSNKMIFTNDYLETAIRQANNNALVKQFNNLNIQLKDDGIIHGDLFCDNAKFLKNELSGVYDFSEACRGDFLFDLAVVAISWCFDNDQLNSLKLDTLLVNYNENISVNEFYDYIKYALVYYATMRLINNRDYQELLKRLENL